MFLSLIITFKKSQLKKNYAMKKSFIILLLVILCVKADAQWQNCFNNSDARTLLACGYNIFAGTDAGVYLSSNNGNTWDSVNTGLPLHSFVPALAIKGDTIFAGTSNGVYLSSSNGSHWEAASTGIPSSTVVWALAVKGDTIFAGATGIVFYSINDGNSWSTVSIGLSNTMVWSFAISGNNIFASTDDGVFISTNNGLLWNVDTVLNNDGASVFAESGNNIFAGGDGVYSSSNYGNSWLGTGLPNTDVTALAIFGNNLFAGVSNWGTPNSGVFFHNYGGGWTNTGLSNDTIWTLAISGDTIFAGTMGGVWFLPIETVGIKDINNANNIAIYPNPATNTLTIETPQAAVIEITNIQGQLIKTLTTTGNKTNIDVSALPGGVYILQAKTEKGVVVNKFIKD